MSNRMYKKRQQLLLTRYIEPIWAWHFKANGVVWVRNTVTQEWKRIGKIEATNPRPIARPTIS